MCLYSLGRLSDAILYLNKVITENEGDEYKVSLLILRARIHIKSYNLTEAFHDLKRAISLDENSIEATRLLQQIQDTSDQLRNSALSLSLQDRVQEALNKMTGAITMNPVNAEYNLQRGILYKRLQDFNSAIDDFLIGLDKMNHDDITNPVLFNNFQRHILLTYNDFAIVCYRKKLYDDAITLLNKAIKLEKNEKGFYINRGDCFYKKNEIHFALGDYEQAAEIDPTDRLSRERVAMVNYLIAVEKYDQKQYEESTEHFNIAIENAPNVCKYYISRARTHFLMNDKESAQLDICLSILLDPTNPEIPTIISRIFENKNLSDVLNCPKMSEAKMYLNKHKIDAAFNDMPKITKPNKKTDRNFRNFPNINEFSQEQDEDMELIEKRKNLKKLLKETSPIPFKKENKPSLRPVYEQMAPTIRDPKVFYWKKFNGGIGTKD